MNAELGVHAQYFETSKKLEILAPPVSTATAATADYSKCSPRNKGLTGFYGAKFRCGSTLRVYPETSGRITEFSEHEAN
jgi:hypothetical protein